jgi:hypothetical protein
VKKFVSVGGPLVTLVMSLVMLFASLAVLLLTNSLWGQLEEAQGQLEETQGQLQKEREAKTRQPKTDKGGVGPTEKVTGPATKSQPQDSTKERTQNQGSSPLTGPDPQRAVMLIQAPDDEGASWPYLLFLALGLAVLASFVLVVTSVLSLLAGRARPGRSGAGIVALAPSREETQDPGSGLGSPSEDGRWTKLVEECVEVVDELDEHMDSFDAPRREVAGHVVLRLEEILGRSGVEIISNDATFDRVRHKPYSTHAATDNGAAIHETLSPGFAVGPRVLRRARVRVE